MVRFVVGPVTALAGVFFQDFERGAHGGGKRLLASRVRPVLSKAAHPHTFFPLHRLSAQLSLVVIIVLFYGREEDDVARVAVRSGVGWAGTAASVDRVVPVGATVVNMSDYGRFGGPRFAQLDDDYKVWAAYQRAQLKKDKLWKAVVTDRPASGSDDKKADPVVAEWDAMNEAALATIQIVGGSANVLVRLLQGVSRAPPHGAPGQCAIPGWRRTVDRLVLPNFRLHRPFRGEVNGKALCAAKSQRSGLLYFKLGLNPSIPRSERFSIAAQESQSGFSDLGEGSAAS